jgi:hypothetical protein
VRTITSFAIAFIAYSIWIPPLHAVPVSVSGRRADGQPFALAETRGRVVAITLVSRYTRRELERVNDELKRELGRDVALVTVVDFVGIPRLFHGYARRKVIEGTRGSPVAFVVDDCGWWSAALRAAPAERVDILVLDRAGELRGHFVGAADLARARQLIHALSAEPVVGPATASAP